MHGHVLPNFFFYVNIYIDVHPYTHRSYRLTHQKHSQSFCVIHLSCKYSLIKNFGRIAACRWVIYTDSWYLHKLDSKVQLHM